MDKEMFDEDVNINNGVEMLRYARRSEAIPLKLSRLRQDDNVNNTGAGESTFEIEMASVPLGESRKSYDALDDKFPGLGSIQP